MTGPFNELEARILQRIDAAEGWLPFDEFMAMAMYEPGLGYYSGGLRKFGWSPSDGSDFVTAPELSPLFGRALARQVREALQATQTDTVWEFGAGSGALAEQILKALAADGGGALRRYVIVELSGALRARQEERLSAFGEQVQWCSALPAEMEGVVVGNEVLDAMPVKLLRFDGALWAERGVVRAASGGAFEWQDRPSALRPPYDHGHWVAGTVTEIHQQARAWIDTLGRKLVRGAVFLIDYGFPDAEYYHPQRLGGTLMCHQAHRADADPLVAVGLKDITAHVNFTGIALSAQDAGLEVLGFISQGRFLLNCGIAGDLVELSLAARTMAQRLISDHEMGELFKVIGLCTPAQSFDALGFRDGDRSHRL